jgi:hypothetical protein
METGKKDSILSLLVILLKADTYRHRCHKELGKAIGVEPQGQCVGGDPAKLDLGTFLENAENGCVLWNMWVVQTA